MRRPQHWLYVANVASSRVMVEPIYNLQISIFSARIPPFCEYKFCAHLISSLPVLGYSADFFYAVLLIPRLRYSIAL
jgi:hypothetical protein